MTALKILQELRKGEAPGLDELTMGQLEELAGLANDLRRACWDERTARVVTSVNDASSS